MPPTPLDRIFEDVQLNIDFSKEVTGATKLLDNVLYSNLVESETASSGSNTNNIAVSFAKIYTWFSDLVTFTPDASTKITIKSSALPSGIGNTYSFQEGSIAGSFQVKENQGSWQTIAVHNVATLGLDGKVPSSQLPSYVDDVVDGYYYDGDFYDEPIIEGYLDEWKIVTEEPASFDPTLYYKYDSGTDTYVPGTAGDVWAADTWFTNEDAFYTDATTRTSATLIEGESSTIYIDKGDDDTPYEYGVGGYTQTTLPTPITPESGKIYIDLPTNTTYRWGGSSYISITNPVDVFIGATASTDGVAGLVPAPLIADKDKFLKGDGTWANVSTTDTKVEQNISSANTDFPLLLSYYDKTSATTTAQTVNRVASIYANPSTGNIAATSFNGLTLTAPGAGDANKFLTGAGVWSTISYSPTVTTGTILGSITIGSSSQDIKVPNMVGADGTNAGTVGIVPAPVATDNTLYLRGDADYADPVEDYRTAVNNNTYTLVLNCTNGNPTT